MENNSEMWLPVKGYEGLYEVSNFGRVRSLRCKTRIADKTEKVLKQKLDDKGYFKVNLYKDKTCNTLLINRLVAMAFIPNPSKLPHVGHMDDNKRNNTVENLYWTDPKENNYHNGKMDRFIKAHKDKIDVIAEKLSVKVVGINMATGEKIFFNSMQEAEKNGFSCSKISNCVNGKRKSHKGYKWEKAV